jgi:Enoyl-CoA hydratase/isomerase
MARIHTERDGRVLTATLDDPPYNFLTGAMMDDLYAPFRLLEEDSSTGAVILTSAPDRIFTSHFDVHSGPYPGHGHLRRLVVVHRSRRRPRRRCPTQRSRRIFQLAVESSQGPGRPSLSSHQAAETMHPYPGPLGPADLTNDQFEPTSGK